MAKYIFGPNTSTEYKHDTIKDSLFNEAFLKGKENEFNWIFKTRGFVFESEILRALGLAVTSKSVIYGYILDEDDPTRVDHIDFHIKKLSDGTFSIDLDTRIVWNLMEEISMRRHAEELGRIKEYLETQ